MWLRWLLPALGFALAAITPAWAERATEDEVLAGKTPESLLLLAARGRVTRQNSDLILHLKTGKTLTFHSRDCHFNSDNARDCHSFALVSDLPTRHAFLVSERLYEGTPDFFLIDDRSGRQTKLAAIPTFAPDDARFLLAIEDTESDDALEIWRRQGDGWTMEWSQSWKEAYANDPALKSPYAARIVDWVGNSIHLQFSIGCCGLNDPPRSWPGSLSLTPDGWRLESRPPQKR